MKPTALSRNVIETQHQGHINANLCLALEIMVRTCKVIPSWVCKGVLGALLHQRIALFLDPGNEVAEAKRYQRVYVHTEAA